MSTRGPSLAELKKFKRKSATQESLIEISEPAPGASMPLVIEPAVEDVDLVTWAKNNNQLIREKLLHYAGILFRGFDKLDANAFEEFIEASFERDLLTYTYRSTPRTQVEGKIFTSTEYPHHIPIPLHSESAFASTWPMKIVFTCHQVARSGGETPIADSRRVYERIDPAIRTRFREKGIMYVRNYAEKDVDLSWQDVFQTKDRGEVARYCSEAGIQLEWRQDNRLRTWQICQGVARHPETREWTWFNQAHLFHISNLHSELREFMESEYDPEDLPRNSYYGDGSTIETSVLDEVREAYRELEVVFPWREGDILMLDNMLSAHGRKPFEGPRKVLVGMAAPFHAENLEELV